MIVGEFRKNKKTDATSARLFIYRSWVLCYVVSVSVSIVSTKKGEFFKVKIMSYPLLDLSWDLIMWFYVYIIDHLFRHRDHRNGASLTCRRSSAVVVVVATELITRTQNMKLDFRAFFCEPRVDVCSSVSDRSKTERHEQVQADIKLFVQSVVHIWCNQYCHIRRRYKTINRICPDVKTDQILARLLRPYFFSVTKAAGGRV